MIRTTGAARSFLDRPVTDAELYDVLDLARFAPSGGNRQGWRVIVVRDPEVKRRIRDLSLITWRQYRAQVEAGEQPFDASGAETSIDMEAVGRVPRDRAFVDDMDRAPVLLVIAADLTRIASTDRYLDRVGIVGGASIYPFVQNLLLSARGAGLGGVLTTFLVPSENDVRDLLGLPGSHAVAAVVALGHVESFPKRLTRRPVEEFATVGTFGGPPLERDR